MCQLVIYSRTSAFIVFSYIELSEDFPNTSAVTHEVTIQKCAGFIWNTETTGVLYGEVNRQSTPLEPDHVSVLFTNSE